MARSMDYSRFITDPLDYKIEHEGTQPSTVLPREGLRSLLVIAH
jgi:hypothetical protein